MRLKKLVYSPLDRSIIADNVLYNSRSKTLCCQGLHNFILLFQHLHFINFLYISNDIYNDIVSFFFHDYFYVTCDGSEVGYRSFKQFYPNFVHNCYYECY